MNLRAHPPSKAEARRAGFRLAWLLLPGVALTVSSVATEYFGHASRPYLTATGAPALRFGDAPPPPPPWVRPAAGAPPVPAQGGVAAAPPDPTAESTPEMPDTPAPAAVTPDIILPPSPQPPAKVHAPILPDDTRPKVRAEDFLPFFQFPGSATNAGEVTVVTPAVPGQSPAPASQPRSSATYRQQ